MLIEMRKCEQCGQLKDKSEQYFEVSGTIGKVGSQIREEKSIEACSVNCAIMFFNQLVKNMIPDANGAINDIQCVHGHPRKLCPFGCPKGDN